MVSYLLLLFLKKKKMDGQNILLCPSSFACYASCINKGSSNIQYSIRVCEDINWCNWINFLHHNPYVFFKSKLPDNESWNLISDLRYHWRLFIVHEKGYYGDWPLSREVYCTRAQAKCDKLLLKLFDCQKKNLVYIVMRNILVTLK